MQEQWKELRNRLARVQNLRYASALLGWDQEVLMPPKGTAGRAELQATVDKMAHELFTADEIGQLLQDLEPQTAGMDYDSDEASLVRVTKRDYEKARRVPPDLVEDLSRATALGLEKWTQARAESNFLLFQPSLERIMDLEIQLAEKLGYQDRIYDALLDQYETGMTTTQVSAIFQDLRRDLVPLVQAIASRINRVDNSVLCREYEEQKQWEFGVEVIKALGFDFAQGRIDKSVHPFTTGFGLGDTRITTRVDRRYLPSALFGSIHETGHALYDMGFRPELERTPLAGGATLGVHESQSRLWENLVGRSRGFWHYFFPRLRQFFPQQLADVDEDSFYRAINFVKPSFIRVEADEVTYNLHIMLRFELENDLVERRIRVSDVPDAWNAKMKEFLGITPSNDAEGCLQDIHWSFGLVGYFATYSLGNLFSVQLFNQALKDEPEISEQISRGEFSTLLGWLRKKVHQHGRKFTLNEIAERATGSPVQSKSYLSYLEGKFGEIYGL